VTLTSAPKIDAETVYKRRAFLNAATFADRKKEGYEASIPRLDIFPSPPSWKKRKRESLERRLSMTGTLPNDMETPSRTAEVQRRERHQREASPEDKRRRKGKGPVRFQSPLVLLERSPTRIVPIQNDAVEVPDSNNGAAT
jgi:hypothetical protein